MLQIQQAFRHVHAPEAERPRAILVQSVTGEGLERVARNAVRAGIGWIVLNRRVPYVEELRQLRPDLAIAAVTPDQEAIGRIHARQIQALAPGGGPVLYVQGPADTSAAQDRLRATQEALAGEPFHWKVVNGDWSEASGERAVAGWLRLKTAEGQRPQLLVAQNDAMAVGARRAAVAHNAEWRRVPVIGCDGLPDGGQRLVSDRRARRHGRHAGERWRRRRARRPLAARRQGATAGGRARTRAVSARGPRGGRVTPGRRRIRR